METRYSKQSVQTSTTNLVQLNDVVAEVNFGDDKMFVELANLHDYYYEWRRGHPNQLIMDGSPISSVLLKMS